ncbi:hypothetical protein HKD37_03G007177 [Glycine soja]
MIYDYTTSLCIELCGILNGLKLVWESGYRYLIYESDSQCVMDMINQGVNSSQTHAPLIQAIKGLVVEALIVSIRHTFHEGNFCVD